MRPTWFAQKGGEAAYGHVDRQHQTEGGCSVTENDCPIPVTGPIVFSVGNVATISSTGAPATDQERVFSLLLVCRDAVKVSSVLIKF